MFILSTFKIRNMLILFSNPLFPKCFQTFEGRCISLGIVMPNSDTHGTGTRNHAELENILASKTYKCLVAYTHGELLTAVRRLRSGLNI